MTSDQHSLHSAKLPRNPYIDLYPPHIQALFSEHWSPVKVAQLAADFLNTGRGARILDVGSGVGVFCLAAAKQRPSLELFGVEQRLELHQYAKSAKQALDISNVHFIHANFTQIDFNEYDHFYFFNSFYENLPYVEKIDDEIAFSSELYRYYNAYLFRQMKNRPEGTRIVTYHSMDDEIPSGYEIMGTAIRGLLKCWIKT